MKLKASKNLIVLIVFFALTFSVSLYTSTVYQKPIGADIVFHLKIVDAYLQGQNGMFAAHVMEINQIPYPPLFHMILLPSVALGVGNTFLLALQALLYPVCLLITIRIVQVHGYGNKHAIIAATALLGSFAYLDATFQIRPESLDILLWLIVLYSALTVKPKLMVASSILGIYNHSLPSLILNGGILLKNWTWKRAAIIILASLPIIALSAIYLAPMLGKWVGTPASPQARQFLTNFPAFTFNYLGALLIGLPITAYEVYKWKALNPLAKYSVLTVVTSLLLLPVWYDRYYQYVSIPLAILIGDFMLTRKGKIWIALLAYMAFFIVFFFALKYGSLWVSNFQGGWDIH